MITAGTQGNRIGGNPRSGRVTRRGRQPLRPRSSQRKLLLLFGGFCLAGVFFLASDLNGVSQFVNRPVTKVRMENHWQRIDEGEIRVLVAPFMGAGFFKFDVTGLKDVLEAHPWIAEAAVKRLWPDSIAILLKEEVAIARWGESAVLNQSGEIFTPYDVARLNALPLLSGPDGSQIQVMRRYQAISEMLFPSGMRLTALELSRRGSWQLTIDGQFRVAVGRDHVMNRLQRFVDFYQATPPLQAAAIESVDLRYDNGIAVGFADTDNAELAAN